MSDNIVIFGPTHSGKSTLMGYLKVLGLSKEKYEREKEHIKKNIIEEGLRYKKDMALAYFVDTGKDERMTYDKGIKSKGGSKRIHISEVGLELDIDCTFIDTPGSDVGWKHKNEGIFLGDIGIYIIEINRLLELSRKVKNSNAYNNMIIQLFSPVYLWKHYKRMKRLIVALSKVDLALYGQYAISRAEKVLRSFELFKYVPIIPISIDVDKREDNNVIVKSPEKMSWYLGKSLIEELKKMLDKEHKENSEEPCLLAHIENIYERTNFNNQPAIRVKILNGSIQLNDEVFISPIKDNGHDLFIKGKVLSLKNTADVKVESLNKGDIGGIVFSRIWKGRERIKLKPELLKRTSMVLSSIENSKIGNLLYFNVNKKKLSEQAIEKFESFGIGYRISLIWFGKIISMHLLNIIDNEDKYSLVLINTSSKESVFILPEKKNGKFFYEEYVLKLDELIFANAVLSDIELVSETERKNVSCRIEGNMPEWDQNNFYRANQKIDIIYNSEFNVTDIIWKNLTSNGLKVAMEKTARYIKNQKIENYKVSILPAEILP